MKNTRNSWISDFLELESAGGILLMCAALLALVCANTPMQSFYALLLDVAVEIRVGALTIAKPLLLWINDGLMAVFFLLIGLELKRELVEGELSDRRRIVLPRRHVLEGAVRYGCSLRRGFHHEPVHRITCFRRDGCRLAV